MEAEAGIAAALALGWGLLCWVLWQVLRDQR